VQSPTKAPVDDDSEITIACLTKARFMWNLAIHSCGSLLHTCIIDCGKRLSCLRTDLLTLLMQAQTHKQRRTAAAAAAAMRALSVGAVSGLTREQVCAAARLTHIQRMVSLPIWL